MYALNDEDAFVYRFGRIKHTAARNVHQSQEPTRFIQSVYAHGIWLIPCRFSAKVMAKIERNGPVAADRSLMRHVKYNTQLVDLIERITCQHLSPGGEPNV